METDRLFYMIRQAIEHTHDTIGNYSQLAQSAEDEEIRRIIVEMVEKKRLLQSLKAISSTKGQDDTPVMTDHRQMGRRGCCPASSQSPPMLLDQRFPAGNHAKKRLVFEIKL